MTKRLLLFLLAFPAFCFSLHSQLLTWTPEFAKSTDNITITVDAAKGNLGLNNYANTNDVYVHIGVITNFSANSDDWKHVPYPWASTPPAGKATSLGNNKYSYTISNISTFFPLDAGETILKIAILFRNGNGTQAQRNADGSNMYIPIYTNELAVRFTVPPFQPKYIPEPEPIVKNVGDNIALTAVSSQATTLNLYLNGSLIQTASAVTTISANPALSTAGNKTIIAEATDGTISKKDSVKFYIAAAVNVNPLPAGVRDGINYLAGNTSAVLVLFAPGKNRVSVIGEFPGSNWAEQPSYQMNKTPDGNYWWLQINGLTPGNEYAFQYMVDGSLKIADPYTEKILDPANDGGITNNVYPGLRQYPAGQSGNVSIIQTNAPQYIWRNNSFTGKNKKDLIIYELLMRDFTDAHNWQTVIDTLGYIQRMGVNTIELLPVTEFEGNDSWGYNPSFSFALDKYYGTKNKLKEFIDSCHSRNLAVIMDVVPNHCYGQSPLAQLYWDGTLNRPALNNPWLNPVQPHAFGFGNDFNHESNATKYFWHRVFDFWLREYKMDGFRMDFTKGLTQKASTNDGDFSAYDQSRVNILKDYSDSIWKYFPNSYIILEHLAGNTEEQALQNMGFLLWGGKRENLAYNEATKGFHDNNRSNISSIVYNSGERGFTNPHLVGYMESHDEERIVYKTKAEGNNTVASYNVRNDSIALRRMEAATSLFLTIPGPKMIWEFGERGYDKSIMACINNTIPAPYPSNDSCKLSRKEPRWEYMLDAKRKRLFDITAAILKLRNTQPALFNSTNFTYNLVNNVKYFKISEPNLSALIIANFDVVSTSTPITFQSSGTWYDYLTGETITATGVSQLLPLLPGEYHIYLDHNITNVITTPVFDINNPAHRFGAAAYPNPVNSRSVLELSFPETGNSRVDLYSMTGKLVQTIYSGSLTRGVHMMPLLDKIDNLPGGIYLLRIQTKNHTRSLKILVQ
jgi:pullulanase/glycogen debranching enzyme